MIDIDDVPEEYRHVIQAWMLGATIEAKNNDQSRPLYGCANRWLLFAPYSSVRKELAENVFDPKNYDAYRIVDEKEQ